MPAVTDSPPLAGAGQVFLFGAPLPRDAGDGKKLLGGKGAGLFEMTRLGLPVPPGLTISTEACRLYYGAGKTLPPGLWEQVLEGVAALEKLGGKRFGGEPPLLLSVRSGARVSMPGMMDTVLNLGLNERAVAALARLSGDERFALDSYRRFLAMFAGVVLGAPREAFEEALARKKKDAGARLDTELDAKALRELVESFKAIAARGGRPVPEDPREQLELAVRAVFDSWFGARAVTYRRLYGIPEDWGTAVNVQCMVFGNLGPRSGSGVAFTRDPNGGEARLFGEFLFNAQGEDVVAGVRTPLPVAALAEKFPRAYAELLRIGKVLEGRYRDMQ
ncbi:MAG TPA: PEP/pyruvate-binding domain-containing protein, partial [Elusimicrobiota bacterium]|nr:PEP/pyruvate-binding domain-containing protein [Elusimicrobiota bacterium]